MNNKPVRCGGVGLRIGNNIIVDTTYDDIKPAVVNGEISDHIFLTLLDEQMGAILLNDNFEEQDAIAPQYSYISGFDDDIAIVSVASPRHKPLFGLIDSNLNCITGCAFQQIIRLKNGFFKLLDISGKYGIINKEGHMVFECKYKSIEYNPETNKFEIEV